MQFSKAVASNSFGNGCILHDVLLRVIGGNMIAHTDGAQAAVFEVIWASQG